MSARRANRARKFNPEKVRNLVEIGNGYVLEVKSSFPSLTQMETNLLGNKRRINLEFYIYLPNKTGTALPPITILCHTPPDESIIGDQAQSDKSD